MFACVVASASGCSIHVPALTEACPNRTAAKSSSSQAPQNRKWTVLFHKVSLCAVVSHLFGGLNPSSAAKDEALCDDELLCNKNADDNPP